MGGEELLGVVAVRPGLILEESCKASTFVILGKDESSHIWLLKVELGAAHAFIEAAQ